MTPPGRKVFSFVFSLDVYPIDRVLQSGETQLRREIRAHNYTTVGELDRATDRELLAIKHLGPATLRWLRGNIADVKDEEDGGPYPEGPWMMIDPPDIETRA